MKNIKKSKLTEDKFIADSAFIGKNVKIGHFVTIEENTRIGNNIIIENGAKIYDNCEIGDGSIIGTNSVLRSSTKIGKNSIFGSSSVSEGFNHIGDETTIHAQCHITTGVTVGNHCFIAPFFIASNTPKISDGTHGTAKKNVGKKIETVIEDYVRIGICVSMTPGHRIGHHSEIYQNCLITKDVLPYSIIKAGKDQVGRVIGKT